MTGIMKFFRSKIFLRLRRVVYWLLPPVLLFFIFRKINIQDLGENFKNVHPWLLVAGLSYYPLVVVCAGIRWKVAMKCYFRETVSAGFLVKQYWIGMVLGFFSPGQIGMDLYRVLVAGRKFGHFLYTAFVVISEKIMALLTTIFLVLVAYPMVKSLIVTQATVLERIVYLSYWGGGIGFAVVILIFFLFRHRFGVRFAEWVTLRANKMQEKLRPCAEAKTPSADTMDLSAILKLVSHPRSFFWVFFWSLMIQVISAAGNQIIFRSAGYDISFWVNLFAVPVFYFIFLLPISFGSLGVREGAYILFYGFFGVPAEVALLVSFINLTGILLNNAVGAVLIWTNRWAGEVPTVIPNKKFDEVV